ncbi:putative adenylate-forming enzyme [Noviherbaspirillum humi]|uniref:Putative adenylate-forming enzyme n=1 Tax=Noviherbaspirillum humi TaxID=1688639 RepID=A0A239FB65_9BURK|nr:F390 synthetase-related protein [Noviherbaspirillum humi]SNS53748.1 putative adenylate-forming enzyme [Noviherbaspirillum humi]
MMRTVKTAFSYFRARRLTFQSRASLENYQTKKLAEFQRKLVSRSRYFARFRDLPILEWPIIDKSLMLNEFDSMNTAGIKLQEVVKTALACERSRDFRPKVNGVNVGLSSGTSGQRGVFAIGDAEAARWAGIILAKTLPGSLFSRERVALFLRANSNVYESVQSRRLTFRFFDLFTSLDNNLSLLEDYRPTILIAPAQVLREIALSVKSGQVRVSPKRVISVAEVLEPLDRILIEGVFGKVHQVYQATEGFLASTCRHGTLHLNEEYVHVEPQWLDAERRRFMPIITDFTRFVQPFVRYRLNDVLIAGRPCTCGSATRTLEAIEGRCDDMLVMPGNSRSEVTVFADMLSRVFARSLPMEADYRLIQRCETSLHLHANIADTALEDLRKELEAALALLDVKVGALRWHLHRQVPAPEAGSKRRRILRCVDPHSGASE